MQIHEFLKLMQLYLANLDLKIQKIVKIKIQLATDLIDIQKIAYNQANQCFCLIPSKILVFPDQKIEFFDSATFRYYKETAYYAASIFAKKHNKNITKPFIFGQKKYFKISECNLETIIKLQRIKGVKLANPNL